MKNFFLVNISRSKKYLNYFNHKKYGPKGNTIFYLASYTNSIGYFILRRLFNLSKQNFFKNFYTIFSDILFGLQISGEIIKNESFNIRFKKIVLSWGFKKDFDKNGVFNDKYFNIRSSKKKNIVWFIVYLDKQLPDVIDNNIVLFKLRGNPFLNFFNWSKFIFSKFLTITKGIDFFLVNISSFNFFAETILVRSKNFFTSHFDEIIIPYEGQPFQNEIIKFIKNKNKNVLVTGYIHSPPLPVPTNFIFKKFSPDRIFLNGKDQAFCFEKILGWPKKRINLIQSLRFQKNSSVQKNKIFVPYIVKSPESVLSMINYINNNISNLQNYKIQSHPAAINSRSNINLVSKLKKIIKKSKFGKKNYDLIFIGNSGGISELLERGYSILHVCEDPEFECYSGSIWKSINTIKVTKNIFTYKLKRRGNLINFGKNNADLNVILDY